jgi:gamma-polyglutamate biosynthesis protein CapC
MSDEMIIFGVLASILFHELTQVSPGGIIVPGYIALLLDDPLRVTVTIALSLLTWGAVRLLSEYVILFGKRRFAVFIIVSFLLRFLTGLATAEANLPVTAALVIGYLVPGILANEIDRQGAVKTLSSMLLVAIALKLVFLAVMTSGYL